MQTRTILTSVIALVLSALFYTRQPSPDMSAKIDSAISSTSDIQSSKFNDAKVLAELKKIENVAAFDRPEKASEKAAWSMAWIHLAVWYSWKSTYYWAGNYPKDDFDSYKEYALFSIKFLVDHHDAEEATIFPSIEKKLAGSMAKNHKQHESFLKNLEDTVTYLNSSTSSTFSAPTLRSKIDGMLFNVMQHLAEELDSLDGSKLLKAYSEDEIAEINKQGHYAQQAKHPNNLGLPFILQNLTPGTPFPPAPGFVKTIIGPWMMYWKHKAMWKYTSFPWKAELPVSTRL